MLTLIQFAGSDDYRNMIVNRIVSNSKDGIKRTVRKYAETTHVSADRELNLDAITGNAVAR